MFRGLRFGGSGLDSGMASLRKATGLAECRLEWVGDERIARAFTNGIYRSLRLIVDRRFMHSLVQSACFAQIRFERIRDEL